MFRHIHHLGNQIAPRPSKSSAQALTPPDQSHPKNTGSLRRSPPKVVDAACSVQGTRFLSRISKRVIASAIPLTLDTAQWYDKVWCMHEHFLSRQVGSVSHTGVGDAMSIPRSKAGFLICLPVALLFCDAGLNAQNWQQVWADEFNGTTIDRSIWSFD